MNGKSSLANKSLTHSVANAIPEDQTVRQSLIAKLKRLREEIEESAPLLDVHLSAGYVIWDVLEMINAEPGEMFEVLGERNFHTLRAEIEG